ncbi:glycosyltransferase family 9 protein [Caminibacter sp.]
MEALLKLSSMGDIIHSLIVLPKLNRKIDFIVDGAFKEILDYHPLIENVVSLDLRKVKKEKLKILSEIKKLKNIKYETIYDLQGLLKSAIVGKITGKYLIGYENPREKIAALFYNKKVKSKKKYAVERYLELFEIEDEEYLKNHPKLLFYKDREFEFLSRNKKNVVFIIGATWDCKKVPDRIWIEIGQNLKENIIIPYANEKEKKSAFKIADNIGAYPVKLNLNDLKALIDKSDLLIGNDTGPSFIAWANNVKNIILYGCTYNNKILENKFSKSVEIQKGEINKRLDIMDKMDVKNIIRKVDEFK